MRLKTLLFSILIGSISPIMAQQKEAKVLFIGLDGTRPDALQAANTPTLDSLMASGITTFDSWHLGVTVSGPSWSNMLTGVWEAKHKVTSNNYSGADYTNWPYLPTLVKELRPDLKAVQLITWNPLDIASNGTGGKIYNAGWDLSIDVGNQGQGLITQAAKIQLQDPDLDFLFAYIQDTDGAGHATGFSTSSPAYMNSIENNDDQVKQILNALRARPNYANEEWLIISSTDHGGLGYGHGGNSDQERHIWWIASAPFLKDTSLTGSDPGSFQMPSNPVDPTKVNQVPLQTDVGVTIIDHLLFSLDADQVKQRWNLDGKSWLTSEYYDSTLYENQPGGIRVGAEETELASMVDVYPSRVNDALFIESSEANDTFDRFEVINSQGRVVMEGTLDAKGRTTVNVSSLSPGVYMILIKAPGQGVYSRRIMIE